MISQEAIAIVAYGDWLGLLCFSRIFGSLGKFRMQKLLELELEIVCSWILQASRAQWKP